MAFVGDEYPNRFGFTSSYFRQQGFVRALRAYGLEPDREMIATDLLALGPQGREEARQLSLRLLQRPNRPTAIFAASDTQAMGVLAAAEECGLEVPRQLSVVGYDDIEIASYLGLTTVHQPLFESGREGAQLLLDSLAAADIGPTPPLKRNLSLRLTLRRTTAPPQPTAG